MGWLSKPKAPDTRPLAEAQREGSREIAAAIREGQQLLDRQFRQTRRDYQPWTDAGKWALDVLRKGVESGRWTPPKWIPPGTMPEPMYPGGHERSQYGSGQPRDVQDWRSSPGYQYRVREGQKAIRRHGNVHGSAYSGETLKALQQHGQDIASEEYDKVRNRALQDYQLDVNRRTSRYNQYAGLAGVGQQAVQQLGAFGAQNAQNQANLGIGGAQTLAAGNIQAESSLIQGQLYANQARQQHFENLLSIGNLAVDAGRLFK